MPWYWPTLVHVEARNWFALCNKLPDDEQVDLSILLVDKDEFGAAMGIVAGLEFDLKQSAIKGIAEKLIDKNPTSTNIGKLSNLGNSETRAYIEFLKICKFAKEGNIKEAVSSLPKIESRKYYCAQALAAVGCGCFKNGDSRNGREYFDKAIATARTFSHLARAKLYAQIAGLCAEGNTPLLSKEYFAVCKETASKTQGTLARRAEMFIIIAMEQKKLAAIDPTYTDEVSDTWAEVRKCIEKSNASEKRYYQNKMALAISIADDKSIVDAKRYAHDFHANVKEKGKTYSALVLRCFDRMIPPVNFDNFSELHSGVMNGQGFQALAGSAGRALLSYSGRDAGRLIYSLFHAVNNSSVSKWAPARVKQAIGLKLCHETQPPETRMAGLNVLLDEYVQFENRKISNSKILHQAMILAREFRYFWPDGPGNKAV